MKNFLAPCGMNCELCHAYQRKKTACAGCRAKEELVHTSCRNCAIAHCDRKTEYCNECEQYPCKRLSALDKRYRTNYGMSMISNLTRIKEVGEDTFIAEQHKKYACPVCGKPHTVHYDYCIYVKKTKMELPQKQLKTPHFREQDKECASLCSAHSPIHKRDTRFEKGYK